MEMNGSHLVGKITAVNEIEIERSRVRLFSRLIGLTDPVYFDVEAARKAGYPDLLVPPTYMLGLETETCDIFRTLEQLNISFSRIVLGEQELTFVADVFARDEVRMTTRLVDISEKKGGKLWLLVRETAVDRGTQTVQRLRQTIIARSDLRAVQ